jgi:hypothetical protein
MKIIPSQYSSAQLCSIWNANPAMLTVWSQFIIGFQLSSTGARVLTDTICGLLIFEFSFTPLFLERNSQATKLQQGKTEKSIRLWSKPDLQRGKTSIWQSSPSNFYYVCWLLQ